MILKWFVLFFIASVRAFETNRSVLAMKCCGLEEQLDTKLQTCLSLNGSYVASDSKTDYDGYVEETLSNILLRGNSSIDLQWLFKNQEQFNDSEAIVRISSRPECDVRRMLHLLTLRDEGRFTWLRNGSLVLRSPMSQEGFEEYMFSSEEFCVDTFNDSHGERQRAFLVCACNKVLCINKCCEYGKTKICDGDDCYCDEFKGHWKPFHPELPPPESNFSYEILYGNDGECPEGFASWVANPWIFPSHFTQSYWEYPDGFLLTDKNICYDAIVQQGEPPKYGVMKCYRAPPFWEIVEIGYGLHVFASVLLVLSLVTIFWVPRRRTSQFSFVHDHAMACHALSLLACSVIWTFYINASSTLCQHTPIIIYFSLVAASFWLNVICINMASGFWNPYGFQHKRWRGVKGIFFFYSLYAWGCTAAMSTFTAAMWYSRSVPPGLIRPTFHETRTCFREDDGKGKMATFAYYYGPMVALLIINGLLFSSAAFRVSQLRRNSSILRKKQTSTRGTSFHNRRSVMVYIKLLWLVGVMEMAVEIAAWASNSNEYYFALAAHFIDLLRAVAIFVLCCCKKRTARELRHRLRRCTLLCPIMSLCGDRISENTKCTRVTSISSTITQLSMTTDVTSDLGPSSIPSANTTVS